MAKKVFDIKAVRKYSLKPFQVLRFFDTETEQEITVSSTYFDGYCKVPSNFLLTYKS